MFQVPHVNRTDYQLIDISEDGYVCVLEYPLSFYIIFASKLFNNLFCCELVISFYRSVC